MDARDTPAPAWTRENWRTYQYRRTEFIDIADKFLALGRSVANDPVRDPRWACRALLQAAVAYQSGGMTRRGQVAWRLAQWIHRHCADGGWPTFTDGRNR
jgi:hypothetical protein